MQTENLSWYLKLMLDTCRFRPTLPDIEDAIKSYTEKLSARYRALGDHQNSFNVINQGISIIIRIEDPSADMYAALSAMYAQLATVSR